MKRIAGLILFSSFLLLAGSCSIKKPFYKVQPVSLAPIDESDIDYELYLVGDLGENKDGMGLGQVSKHVKDQLKVGNNAQSIAFLGNTIGPNGVPDEDDVSYQEIKLKMQNCMDELQPRVEGLHFIPGNHEWSDGNNPSHEGLRKSKVFLEELTGNEEIFNLGDGCGEPKAIPLTDNLLLVLVDSQWFLNEDEDHQGKRPGCDMDSELDFITALQEILAGNKMKNIIIASHHPIYTNGRTGGNYSFRDHMLPLPIVGSAITWVKQLFGSDQQFGHPHYEEYRSSILTALSNFEGITTISSHEQNLQHTIDGGNNFVVIGSGSKPDFLSKGGNLEFGLMQNGFAKIIHTKHLELWLEMYALNSEGREELIYRTLLHKKEVIDYTDQTVYLDNKDQPKTTLVQASKLYTKKGLFGGNNYRKEWSTKVNAPTLLLDEVYGGLKPLKQGGGFQTKSLRLENEDGQQFVLRTIDKDVEKIVPPALRNSFAKNLVQDGMAAAHPYGAFAIPKLAEAAQIYHANPKFVWLPHQKTLGDYNKDFAERLYLFEERPGGKMKMHKNYGGSKKSINTLELIEKLASSHKHIVDQKYVLKARLFDILIGDWDRHDDQWRWGIYDDLEDSKHTIYRAIPRDRDQVFFKNDGLLNFLSSRAWFNPQLRKFDYKIDNLEGLVYNARHFDRSFIHEMTKDDFIDAAKELQSNITDEVLSEAFKDWPKDIYNLNGKKIIDQLKSRRSDLVQYAEEFYKYLSKEVTVSGTRHEDLFQIVFSEDHLVDVKHYQISKDDSKDLIWSRVLDDRETKELNLFGLDKGDYFDFRGDHKTSMKIRVIGGSGKDRLNNSSSNKNIIVYDKEEGLELVGESVNSQLSNEKGVNDFNRKDWELDRSFHFPMISFYTDEGIGLSYNIWTKHHGFRSKPYKSSHAINLGFYYANKAIVGTYNGHWPNAIGNTYDFHLDIDGKGPTFTQFFYGLGNQYIDFRELNPTIPEAGNASFHIVRGVHLKINPGLSRTFHHDNRITISPGIEYVNIDDDINDEARFIFTESAGLIPQDFEAQSFANLALGYQSKRLDNEAIPTRGYDFEADVLFRQSLTFFGRSNINISASLKTYIPFTPSHSIVLSSNIGGAYTIGDYEFYHANYLASASRLRGYKLNRFAGDAIIYHASDLRMKLFDTKGAFPTSFGIFGSFDYGRAFLDNENEDEWHTSYGGGIYLTPLDLLGFKIGYYKASKDTQVTIGGSLSF